MQIPSDHPVALHLDEARRCFKDKNAKRCDNAYREAVRQAADRLPLRTLLQEEHLNSLLELEQRAIALERCEAYLDEHRPGPWGLRVLHAEILSALGRHACADTAASDLSEHALSKEQLARMHRVHGLALANDGRTKQARSHLDTARRMFEELRLYAHCDQLIKEISLILGREGYDTMVPELPLRTVPDHLHRAEELKRQARYEEAFGTLRQAVDLSGFEPALYWPVLHEMAVLAQTLRRPDLAERLDPLLKEAADHAPEPRAAHADAVSLRTLDVPDGGPAARRFDARIEHVHRLILSERLEEADQQLEELREQTVSPRDLALWHLAAAHSEQSWDKLSGHPRHLHECVEHAKRAAEYARTNALMEVRIAALRIMGDALALMDLSDSDDRAVERWAEAHRLEEEIAGRQLTDAVRVSMLRAAPDEHDARIRSAVERTHRLETPTAAGIAVAIEAARGAQILPQILPADEHRARDLPLPKDWTGARRWMGTVAAALPRDQAAWLIHATPDKVHHVIICRELFHHVCVGSDRLGLYEAIDELSLCWDGPETLEANVKTGEFGRRLAHVATRLGIARVTGLIPRHVRRLAIVAGNELSDVPLAALPLPDGDKPLGLRYALSDLPCLSALAPLRQRSHGQRGGTVLLVQPGDNGLTPARVRARRSLRGPAATPAGLDAELKEHRHRIVRIDAHGSHERGAWLSTIKLSPEGPDGHLHAERLELMELHGCGTLVLGACESGMARRIGRDERHGFVRAAFNAGAAAVVAARWVAPDATAAILLDRFHRHLRRLPRDLALHAAMLDACNMNIDIPFPRDPSRWACWSLYGDSGFQTKAGPLRRCMRGLSPFGRSNASGPSA